MTGGKGGKNAAEASPGKLPAKASKKAKKAATAIPENNPGGSSARATATGGGYGMAGGGGYQANMNPGSLPYDPFTAGFQPGMNPYAPSFNPAAMAFAVGNLGAPHANQYAGMMQFPQGMPYSAGFQQAHAGMPAGGHVLGGSGGAPPWAGGHAMPQLPQYAAVAPPAPTVAQRRWRSVANALKGLELPNGLTIHVFQKLQADLEVAQHADEEDEVNDPFFRSGFGAHRVLVKDF